MTTGYLLTCGMSVLGHLKPDRKPVRPFRYALEGLPADLLEVLRQRGADPLEPPLRDRLGDVAGALSGVMRAAMEADGDAAARAAILHGLGAELESLTRRGLDMGPRHTGDMPTRPLSPDDPIAIVATPTPEGRLAATLVAIMSGRPVRVWVEDDPLGHPRESWTCDLEIAGNGVDGVAVDVYVVPHLMIDVTGHEAGLADVGAEAIRDSARWLAGALARTVGMTGRADDPWSAVDAVEVELSGGYKATIPLLHTLLEYCAALRAAIPFRCVLRHDSAPGVWVSAGLRRISPEALELDLQELRRVREGRGPSGGELQGFGWEFVRPESPRLTPEGEGILVLPSRGF